MVTRTPERYAAVLELRREGKSLSAICRILSPQLRDCRGHAMRWQLGENALRHRHGLFWAGRCEHCAAEVSVGSGWTSCAEVRDARDEACSGPGIAVLTEIETAHVAELIAVAVAEFGQDIAE